MWGRVATSLKWCHTKPRAARKRLGTCLNSETQPSPYPALHQQSIKPSFPVRPRGCGAITSPDTWVGRAEIREDDGAHLGRGWASEELGCVPPTSFLGSGMRGAGGEGASGLGRGRGGGGCTTLWRVGRIEPAGDHSNRQPAMQTPTQPPECFQAWERAEVGRW